MGVEDGEWGRGVGQSAGRVQGETGGNGTARGTRTVGKGIDRGHTAPLAGGHQPTPHAPRMVHGERPGGEVNELYMCNVGVLVPWLTIRPVVITTDRNIGLVEARPFRPFAIGFVMVFTKRIPSFIKGSAAIV